MRSTYRGQLRGAGGCDARVGGIISWRASKEDRQVPGCGRPPRVVMARPQLMALTPLLLHRFQFLPCPCHQNTCHRSAWLSRARWLPESAPPLTSQLSSHWALMWPLAAGQGLFQETAQREAQLQQRKDTTPPPPTFTGHPWLNTKLKS